MPELPEVETIRLSLQKKLIGKTISNIEVREKKQFIGDPSKATGKKVIRLQRKGKVLTIVLDDNLYLSIHLKLTGQILFAENRERATFKNEIPRTNTRTLPASSTRIIIDFSDNSALYFNDLRKFGWIKLENKLEENSSVDILSPAFTLDYFKKITKNSGKPIKTFLLDQDKITGIGNIYDNDSLWEACIHPARKTKTLSDEEVEKLYDAIKKIIHEGIQYKGSSAKDEMYVLPDSEKGEYQNHFKVYHRDGKPCLRCGTVIKRITLGGRGTFFCPRCQPLTD